MAAVFGAYKFLNQSLGLKLSDPQISKVEREFKVAWAKRRDYGNRMVEPDDWEFFAHLVPRQKKKPKSKRK
ncbi:MAG: hypothetical protein ACR2H4_19780 [Pyrinomonadaceae bacterium]